MGVDKFNHEGYFDPTTYEALTNIHREEMAADKKAAYLPSPVIGNRFTYCVIVNPFFCASDVAISYSFSVNVTDTIIDIYSRPF